MDMDRDSSMFSSFNDNFPSSGAPPPPQPQPQPQPQSQIPIFGLIVASANIRTDFVPVPLSNNTKFTLTITSPGDFSSPVSAVNELVFFFLPGGTNVLPPKSGALIYWQIEVSPTLQSGFELLGYLEPTNRPSDIFRTGWSEREEFIGLSPNNQSVKINIGISIEPLDIIKNLTGGSSNNMSSIFDGNPSSTINPISAAPDKRPMVAHKIAEDLFNFMQSFDTGGASGNQTMVVPANIFDRWWKRFENKLRRDPNFFLKRSD